MKIISIDPGFERVGIAIIDEKKKQENVLIYSNCFKTSAKIPFHQRLCAIGEEIDRVITKYKPKIMAIEKLYFTTNQKTVMGVSEARGVIVYCASRLGLEIFEYTPPQIKVAVTGYGKADKNMIMSMVPKLINIDIPIISDDEMDAVAVGLTCLAHERFSTGGGVLQRK